MDERILSPLSANKPAFPKTNDISVFAMVPTEMYQNIFQFVGKQGLTALSRVSQGFQCEAERILYEIVELTDTIHRTSSLMSWSNAVTNVERRAHRVHTLRFPAHLPPKFESTDVQLDDETVQNKVALAFSAIINLKHLFLLGHSCPGKIASLHLSTLASCTFSLSSFAGQVSGSSAQGQVDFLLKHPNIEYWVPTEPFLRSVEVFPQNMLPNLRQLVLARPSLIRALKNCPIEALFILFVEIMHSRATGLEAIIPLGFLGATLHTLDYTYGPLSPDRTTADIIENLSQNTPNLRTLTLTSLVKSESVTPAKVHHRLVDAVARFHHLGTLVLNIYMGALQNPLDEYPDLENPLEHAPNWEGRSPARARQVATQFMTACPSLRRLSFPDTESALASSLTYVLSGEKVKLVGFYGVDNSRWWMR